MRRVLAALVDLDGGPVGAAELRQLAAGARLPWGGGRPRLWLAEGAGLVAVPAWRRQEGVAGAARQEEAGGAARQEEGGVARQETGGAVAGRFLVVTDGTLDNRAELVRELGLAAAGGDRGDGGGGGGSGDVGAAALVAAALERWGDAAAARLVGEFAFVAWDRGERRLLAARDAFGVRELFYRRTGTRLAVASQLLMLGRPALADLDEEYAADFLAVSVSVGGHSPFRSVRRLPAGHQLSVQGGRIALRRHWDLEAGARAPGRTPADNAEHFLARFREAVGCSLATGGRVWAELSGGLDSSSIVCVARQLLAGDERRQRDFATVTVVWEKTPQSDERRWSQAVVEATGVANHQIVGDDRFFDGAAAAALYRNEPHFGIFSQPFYQAEGELLREAGVEVLLSGARAESVVLGDAPPVHLADLLRGLRLGELGRELLGWQRALQRPLANLLVDFALRPLVERDFHRQSESDEGRLDPWVAAPFARRLDLAGRTRRARVGRRLPSRAEQFQYTRLRWSEPLISRGFQEWAVEVRHPFLHRPLVELAFAIPWAEKVAPAGGKVLLRRALGEILPEPVRVRTGGRGPGAAAYKAYARRWAAIEPLVRRPLLAELGLVDGAAFRRAAELVRFGMAERFFSFASCLAFEVWLRAVTGEGPEGGAVAAAGP